MSEEGSGSWGWLAGAGALIALGAAAWAAMRRRKPEVIEEAERATAATAPLPDMLQAAVPPVVPASRARLTLSFRPVRAGLNMLSATVEGELTVTNTGTAAASDVRARAALLSAHAGHEADLASLRAEPIGRPAAPPFSLSPGEARVLRVVAATPREALRIMTAANRPMFVPVVATDVHYRTADVAAESAQAFAVGVERVDSPKLAPFWLDVPARSYDQVAARPQGRALER